MSTLGKLCTIAVIVIIVTVAGAGLGFVTASINTLPDLDGEIRPAASSQIFDANGKLLATVHSVENRLPVPLAKIPKNLQNAFIANEDVRFYQHHGIDPRGILRAFWTNLTGHGVSEGGSTITQQLAKNAFLSQERTLKRKIHEAILAIQIERHYTKAEILEMYLNQIYFGQGAYGVQAAAQIYFGKNVENLDLAECAMLAGIPKSPNYYSPYNNLKAAKERQAIVLDQMVKYGYIEQDAAARAKAEDIHLAPRAGQHAIAPYFIDYVIQTLVDKYGADAVYKEGLKIYTTLDLDMQRAAEKALTALPVTKIDSNGLKQPQGAIIALDPQTGYIKAMVGGRGGDQFNRAVMAVRQPGSAFKPFVYLTALENGFTPATVIDDRPISFGNWSPQNYDRKFRGHVTLRTALEQSLNVPTVILAQKVGPEKILHNAQLLGITTLVTSGPANDLSLAMALGGLTRGVTPLELASAYGVLANQGVKAEPVAILKVVDRNGKILEEYQPQVKAVISDRIAYLLTDMMRGVLTRGTGTGAAFGRPAAGKTGTTSDYRDAWFVGFTPNLVAAVWMGCDNNEPLNGITGGWIPATIWRQFMSEATAKLPVQDFVQPKGIVTAAISPKDGLLAPDPNSKDARHEIFIEGTQPTRISPPLKPVKPEDKTLPPLPPPAKSEKEALEKPSAPQPKNNSPAPPLAQPPSSAAGKKPTP